MEEQSKKNLARFIVIAIPLAMIVWFFLYPSIPKNHDLKVDFFDVGQGDATLVTTASGNQILIDGGPGTSVITEIGHVMPYFDRTIELVILSHPHEDHVSGLIEVLRRYKVKEVVLPDVEFDSPPFWEFISLLEAKQIKKTYAHEGQRIFLDNSTVFDVYYPPPGHFMAANNYSGLKDNKRNPNDVSIVGKLSYGKARVLFTGDAGKDIEEMLLPKYNLDSDILKVGHQGSRFSSSQDFLEEVTPQYSVIMVGENSFGHPTQEAMGRIKSVGSEILRTDLSGTIEFTSNGQTIEKK